MLGDAPIDYMTGNRVAAGGFIEHFRRDANGQVEDTQYQLASRDGYYYEGDQREHQRQPGDRICPRPGPALMPR